MSKLIDLSYPIHSDMPVYPGSDPPMIKPVAKVANDGYLEHCVSFYTHTGTHLDAPAHILDGGNTVDAYACEKFYGSAVIVDCKNVQKIELGEVQNAYKENGNPDFLLFYTGWADRWGTEAYYHDFPVLTEEATGYLCTLPLKGVGIDAISFDPFGDEELVNHHLLLEQEIILVENLRSLKQLLSKEFNFSCLPLRIKGVDGFPVRAVGIL